MSSKKRKRLYTDVKGLFFPDDVESGCHKAGGQPSSLSFTASARSWKKCGESFVDTQVMKTCVGCDDDSVDIAWTSSDSEQSDDETTEHLLSRAAVQQRPQRPRRVMAPVRPYNRMLNMLGADNGEPPVIDTDSDVEEYEKYIEDDGQQISDCDSFDEKADLSLNATNVTDIGLSGNVSDGESVSPEVTSSRPDTESFALQSGDGSSRSVSDWVRSAQLMLQTPQKQINKQSRTPEDSAKKKRKFQRGGLAERLNRLQCRQRSAVSFWRHQSGSEASAVDRPGVLVLEVLKVQEEGSMQLAHCERHRPPGEGHQHHNPISEEREHVLVLFTRKTTTQLIPTPGDVIHIYPPWQSLSIEGFSFDIILNTHFSQKMYSATKPADMSTARGLHPAERCRPYSLCTTFGMLNVCRATEGNDTKETAAVPAFCSSGGFGGLTRRCVSLLEAVEALGQAGSVGQDVEVVVQRVYSIAVPDNSPMSIRKPRGPSFTPSAEKGSTRLCLLVQDFYGMFSEVQLHLLPCSDALHQYCVLWQGKSCVLRGVKVVQRVTRERRSRLFSLIDSLWPPVMPVRDHGNTTTMSSDSRPAGPAPSFCYLLSGQESSVAAVERAELLLYSPPSKKTLRDILQSNPKTCRCSFTATVLYKRIMQCKDIGQGEVWLVLTDASLQREQPEMPCKRTVALCVNTSCVLTSSVLEALRSSAVCRISFRDAVKEHDLLLGVEQTVIDVCSEGPDGDIEHSSGPVSDSLSGPLTQLVRLDPLSPEVTPNSVCCVTGVIVGVDENSAYSWPACNHCGGDSLEISAGIPQNFHCVSCKLAVEKPDMRIQMEVFLSSSLSNCTLKVKLHQQTIKSILSTAALEGSEFSGYDVENVLGKEVGPLTVYVQAVTRKPALWIGLEEICL
ncbi:DNA repair-scaffolding protein isoform X2 [Antennarius striatus]|uniref:DNA repair-scaffolding protein isoform X2 n=1 Tax=Antennarius striatus TaxID=241820 RepID=UPI0035ADB43F